MPLFGPPDVGKLKRESNVDGLIKALRYKQGSQESEHIKIRKFAAQALGQLGLQQALEPLLTSLKDGEIQVRQAAAVALGQLRNAQAVETLIATLADENWQFARPQLNRWE